MAPNSNSSSSSGYVMTQESAPNDQCLLQTGMNIVSDQSTSRPGCIIELDLINESIQVDLLQSQLLEIYIIILYLVCTFPENIQIFLKLKRILSRIKLK